MIITNMQVIKNWSMMLYVIVWLWSNRQYFFKLRIIRHLRQSIIIHWFYLSLLCDLIIFWLCCLLFIISSNSNHRINDNIRCMSYPIKIARISTIINWDKKNKKKKRCFSLFSQWNRQLSSVVQLMSGSSCWSQRINWGRTTMV
jgi:hypothetical protein